MLYKAILYISLFHSCLILAPVIEHLLMLYLLLGMLFLFNPSSESLSILQTSAYTYLAQATALYHPLSMWFSLACPLLPTCNELNEAITTPVTFQISWKFLVSILGEFYIHNTYQPRKIVQWIWPCLAHNLVLLVWSPIPHVVPQALSGLSLEQRENQELALSSAEYGPKSKQINKQTEHILVPIRSCVRPRLES